MPYKNKEDHKKYQKGWYQRKKQGIETRLTTPLADKERERRKKDWNKRAYHNRRKKIKKLKEKYCGKKCTICPNTRVVGRISCHRIDGQDHKNIDDMPFKDMEKELKTRDYISLCTSCHKSVHWCMKFFGLNWEQIIRLIKARIV